MWINKNNQVLLLALLVYLSSGAILGFIETGWPLLLQREGVAIRLVSMIMFLALPFGIAMLWAPLVDRYWFRALGHRRSWILSMQILIVLMLVLAVVMADHRLLLGVCLGFCSLFAATLDLALDALLIESCAGEKQLAIRGPLKVGGLLAGGLAGSTLSVWLYQRFAMQGSLSPLLIIALLTGVCISVWRERPVNVTPSRACGWFDFRHFFAQPGSCRMVLMAVTMTALIEMGLEAMRLYLVSQHIPLTRLSVLFGPLGNVVGIVGAVTGGYVGQRFGLLKVIVASGVLLSVMIGLLGPFAGWFSEGRAATVSWMVLAGFTYTLLSASVFSFSMLWCRRSSHLASDFASVQCAWVLSGILGASLSGSWVSQAGWTAGFAGIAVGLLLACLLIPAVPRDLPAEQGE